MPQPTNPFGMERTLLGRRLYGAAGAMGQQGGAFLSSQGMFDPNLAETMRSRAFGQASEALATGVADIAGRSAMFGEMTRQFEETMTFRESELLQQLELETRRLNISEDQFAEQMRLMWEKFEYDKYMFEAGLRAEEPTWLDYLTAGAEALGALGSFTPLFTGGPRGSGGSGGLGDYWI